MRSTTLGLSGEITIIGTANVRSRTPVLSGEYPSTNCRYWVSRKIDPNIARNVIVIAALAALNRGLRQKRMSSIGWSTRRSHAKNAARSSPPAKKKARMRGAVQPPVGPSITA